MAKKIIIKGPASQIDNHIEGAQEFNNMIIKGSIALSDSGYSTDEINNLFKKYFKRLNE